MKNKNFYRIYISELKTKNYREVRTQISQPAAASIVAVHIKFSDQSIGSMILENLQKKIIVHSADNRSIIIALHKYTMYVD